MKRGNLETDMQMGWASCEMKAAIRTVQPPAKGLPETCPASRTIDNTFLLHKAHILQEFVMAIPVNAKPDSTDGLCLIPRLFVIPVPCVWPSLELLSLTCRLSPTQEFPRESVLTCNDLRRISWKTCSPARNPLEAPQVFLDWVHPLWINLKGPSYLHSTSLSSFFPCLSTPCLLWPY